MKKVSFGNKDILSPDERIAIYEDTAVYHRLMNTAIHDATKAVGYRLSAYQIHFLAMMLKPRVTQMTKIIYDMYDNAVFNQIKNEVKYPYICNYGYTWKRMWIRPRCRLRATLQMTVAELRFWNRLSLIQRNAIYGVYGRYKAPFATIPKELMPPPIKVEAPKSPIFKTKILPFLIKPKEEDINDESTSNNPDAI